MTTRVVNVRAETYDVYIGRKKGGSVYDTGDWGNPCVIGKDGTREEVIEKYRVHLKEQVRLGLRTWKQLRKLYGKSLGCYCSPDPCHGDVIIEAINIAMDCKTEKRFLARYLDDKEEEEVTDEQSLEILKAREMVEEAEDDLNDALDMLHSVGGNPDASRVASNAVTRTRDKFEKAQEELRLMEAETEEEPPPIEQPPLPEETARAESDKDTKKSNQKSDTTQPSSTKETGPMTTETQEAPAVSMEQMMAGMMEQMMAGMKSQIAEAVQQKVNDVAPPAEQATAPPPEQPAPPVQQAEWQRDYRHVDKSNRDYVDVKRLNSNRDAYVKVGSYPKEHDSDLLFSLIVDANPPIAPLARDGGEGIFEETKLKKGGKFVLELNGTLTDEIRSFFYGAPLPNKTPTPEIVVAKVEKNEPLTKKQMVGRIATDTQDPPLKTDAEPTPAQAKMAAARALTVQYNGEGFTVPEIQGLLAEDGMIYAERTIERFLQ